jgi:AraC-like DNA-binding protein
MNLSLSRSVILALCTHRLDVQIHRHAAYQLVYSVDAPFQSVIGGQLHQNLTGFLITPQTVHLCSSSQSTLHILNVEPYSSAGLFLKTRFVPGIDVRLFHSPDALAEYFSLPPHVHDLTRAIANTLHDSHAELAVYERVTNLVAYIEQHYGQSLSPESLSDIVFLSPSRLAALFKQQTGSSLSKYLLWTRLRQAISMTLQGHLSLTQIALEAGFYDLPQLDKYMHALFGISPRGLQQNSDLIQVLGT